MKTLQEVKDERAYEMEYSDWQEFIYSIDDPDIVDREFDEVSNRFAKEVAREALKNAAKNSTVTAIQRDGFCDYVSDKESILDESNIPEL